MPLNVHDHAVGRSGPHRNVAGTLNALAARDDVLLRLLCGEVDPTESYARSGRTAVHLGFRPHSPAAIVSNLMRLRRAARGMDVIYVPTGLKSFLLAWAAGGGGGH